MTACSEFADDPMKPRAVCTVMDRNYLTRGLALYASLRKHGPAYDLHVLCMDQETWDILSHLAPTGLKRVALQSVMDEGARNLAEGLSELLTAE